MIKKVFIISGEESGDLHGGTLITALKKLVPSLEVGGMGGEKMRKAGLKGPDSKEVSVVGVVEVIEKLPKILKTFRELKKTLADGGFDCVVLIDFPDFNLRFAKEAKKLGVPVIYYISPQVWAWRKGRVKEIARLVDKMLVVFPFETGIYKEAGVDVEYVGHPLADITECGLTREGARKALGIESRGTVISLLPGSRTGEVKRLLGAMLKAGEIMEKGLGAKDKPLFILPAANSIDDSLINEFTKKTAVEVMVVRGAMYSALRASDAAVVASGTATLETALIGTPMAIIYKMSPVSYGIAKALVGVKNVGLPNIVAGRRVVPELIQGQATPEGIAAEILGILNDGKKRAAIIKGYKEIKRSLGVKGAADKAAKAIYRVINK
ncbi:MAG: lipid-A-disaccharide synthase [Deltaproteobacteria bacterium]|nr:lipid-A-disaccharide synthase [Deltaproteobacteria bacterium]